MQSDRQTDRQTDRHTYRHVEANSHFCNFVNMPEKYLIKTRHTEVKLTPQQEELHKSVSQNEEE